MSTNVIDVTEATFEAEVLQRSLEVPVVIDFWADWCQPCKMLSPILEKAVAARSGDVVLAKVDVDANPRLAQAFQVQGIPSVKAVADGRLVAEFTGAQPPAYVERFLDAVAPRRERPEPTPAEAQPVDPAAAAERWRAALDEDPSNVEARTGLAGLRLAAGDLDAADELLQPIAQTPEAAGLLSLLRLLREAADPLSPYAAAARQAADGAPGEALAILLGAVRSASGDERERPRQLMVAVFRVLGDTDPLTQHYRRALTAALF
jgi:putative thioredoxin